MSRNNLLVRYIALVGVRNTMLEKLHSGVFPYSNTGDFSDVKVVVADGEEIPWNKISRISDKEMRELMLDIEKRIEDALHTISALEKDAVSHEGFNAMLNEALLKRGGASWDVPAM